MDGEKWTGKICSAFRRGEVLSRKNLQVWKYNWNQCVKNSIHPDEKGEVEKSDVTMVNQVETFLPSGSRSRQAPWNAKENDFHVQLKSHITIYKQSYFKEINKCIFSDYTNGLKIIYQRCEKY